MFPFSTLAMKSSVFSLSCFIVGSYCNGNNQGMFLSPADGVRNAAWSTNPIWAVGEKHTLKWNTTQTTYNISLWQQNTATNIAGQGVSPVFSWSKSHPTVLVEVIYQLTDLQQAVVMEMVREHTIGSSSLQPTGLISTPHPSSSFSPVQGFPSLMPDSPHAISTSQLLQWRQLQRHLQASQQHPLHLPPQ